MRNITKLKLISPLPYSVNHYLGIRAYIKNGKAIGTMYETSEAKKYKKNFAKYVKEECLAQNYNIAVNETQHFYCDCVFYFDRVDRDPNNYFKLLLDAITDSKCIWKDDNVVCERVNSIYYDRNNPRIELEIYPVDYIGIFKNNIELENFKHQCIFCKRYRDGKCKILNNAICGIIQEEICNSQCLKKSYKNTFKAKGE